MKLPINNLSYPVKISAGKSSGSGFLVVHNQESFLVTARHVLYQLDPVSKSFILYSNSVKILCYTFSNNSVQKLPTVIEADLNVLSLKNNLKMSNTIDLVVFKLADFKDFQLIAMDGVSVVKRADGDIIQYDMSNARRFDQVEITNDIFTLGYPTSLSTQAMNQIDYDSPLARKGIVAGKNYINKTLILDCPVYGGNSGGLVLEINAVPQSTAISLHLIGVVVQFVPFVDQWQNVRFPDMTNMNLQNSGYSVALPVDHIFDLIDLISPALLQ